ncbi:hypothetical protein SAMN05216344_114118 [Polaromonas sp. OV174]|uniref:hypothetical protein n=1 Tax=Polaromonas sp. OV174 TaxID=1855300 RepID=UPI0008F0BC3D|nr:hypothetical protein [Polaromonas sp. OV174]SFC34496.1 hypothetical protein SAMN05216344_114118 [Polaromonas sp. OV174]
MTTSVFVETGFWLLVLTTVALPFSMYGILRARRVVSSEAMLMLGFILVLIAGVDVYLLRDLSELARHTPSLADDAVFSSALSIGLYLLPAMFAGIGINLVSHLLLRHLAVAEKQFDKDHPRAD